MERETVKDLSFVLYGEQSLVVQCADLLRQRGHRIAAVVTEDPRVLRWARDALITAVPTSAAAERPQQIDAFDFLISVTNLPLLPDWLLQAARRGTINFHDGPATRNQGRNAPVWAIVDGDAMHGITWHLVQPGSDSGRVLLTREFPIHADDNAFALNSQCYQAGLESFPALLDLIEAGNLSGSADFDQRPYRMMAERPEGGAVLDWRQPAQILARLVRGLDFAHVPNPVLLPKLDAGKELLVVRRAVSVAASGAQQPGEILALTPAVTVRCGDGALQILQATTLAGDDVDLPRLLSAAGLGVGSLLRADVPEAVSAVVTAAGASEILLQRRLQAFEASELPFAQRATSAGRRWLPLGKRSLAALLLLVARVSRERRAAVAYMPRSLTSLDAAIRRHVAGPLPLIVQLDDADNAANWSGKVHEELERLERATGFIADLPARAPSVRTALQATAKSPWRIVRCRELPAAPGSDANSDSILTIHVADDGDCCAQFDEQQLSSAAVKRLADCWAALELSLQDKSISCRRASLLSAEDVRTLDVLEANPAQGPAASVRIHEQFEARVRERPDHKACVFEGQSLTYTELNMAANRLARHLQSLGVARGTLVGVNVPRSLEMLVALLAIHKAGAAYLPLDPTYPPERLAYMATDAGVSVVLSRSDVLSPLAVPHNLLLDRMAGELAALPAANLDVPGDASDLAYVMYTSGSTGKPKGVMVEHRNVVNFFDGIDDRMGAEPGVWLAITSISFDISVLELFWTLARGFTVVLHGDALRQKGKAAAGGRSMAFGLFYWNVATPESDHAKDKYRLLLESARFADEHGFASVWTPERHFESFGGLFPNPSVTSAALATITRNVQLRAGSCVLPLHSPIRVAEEWSVVDNLSNGRVGISVAAGWAAPDFAIKPENFADAKNIMFENIEVLRRLWRGETVELPGPKGMVAVRTLPRPIQSEIPIWVTAAMNVDTFIQAGKCGAHLLTHLLGQTIEETAVKIAAYRRAWTEAGHAGRGIVTVMLHTFVGPDRDTVEAIVRQPMKHYLKSAVTLLKAAAWQSPTFKKMSEAGGKSLDEFFASASDEDMDQMLEFAFQRYFRTSGLFGSPQDCQEVVDKAVAADVDEIACLIDFGIDADKVLAHLPWLDQLRQQSQQQARAGDYSIATLLTSERVTHFQCTPTMASLLVSDVDAQPGLAALKQMMVGGEALAPDLARSLAGVVRGQVSNMYGPTETTIWSTSAKLDGNAFTPSGSVTIGTPLRNQVVHVLDDFQQQLPPGLTGELVIGGLGVTRGYWRRPDLTDERFLADGHADPSSGARMYRTGDLGRWLPDGRMEFLGRRDQQVKIHGYRIELGEIETLLREDPQVADAVVILREDSPGDKRLVGYVQAVRGANPDTAALRQHLAAKLPDFMVPSMIMSIPELPQTPNGKIDRKALPAPARAGQVRAESSRPQARPQSNLESMVAEIWRRVLGLNEIGIHDNFFDIGGHSLLIIQVLRELREKVPRPIQMTDLFRHTTIETLARFLEGGDSPSDTASQRGRSRAEARRAAAMRAT